MKYSLIFTVYNESSNINSFIDSLVHQTVPPDEIVIVDGGSTDNTALLLESGLKKYFKNVKVIVDKTCSKKYSKGPIAKGRNVAIANASYDNILVTDAGCIMDSQWVESMKIGFESGADVISGVYKAHITNKFQKYIAPIFCKKIIVSNPKDFEPSSRSFGFKKSLWTKVGGYPENSYTAEDTKFVRNLFSVTDNVFVATDACVYWDLPIDFNESRIQIISATVMDWRRGEASC